MVLPHRSADSLAGATRSPDGLAGGARGVAPRPAELVWSDFVHADGEVVVLKATRDDSTVSVYDATTLELLWSAPETGATHVGGGPGRVAITDLDLEEVTVYAALSGEVIERFPGVITSTTGHRW